VKKSSERILTTHTGSLPRSKALTALLVKREQRKALDLNALKAQIERNLDYVVTHQQESGVDIGNDGETPRVGFSTYITERMNGFGGESRRKPSLDQIKFPEFAASPFMSMPLMLRSPTSRRKRSVSTSAGATGMARTRMTST
jgi:5-methyltetrahydropteroyltriglutamate--homocysteine methyltransferase